MPGHWTGDDPRLLKKIPDSLEDFVKQARENVGKAITTEFVDKLKQGWQSQSLGLTPLTQAWLKEKRKRGWDLRILIATQALVGKVEPFTLGGDKWIGGILGGSIHKEAKLDFIDLMRAHEYGGGNLPARPAFQNTLRQLGGKRWVRKFVREKMREFQRDYFSRIR